MNCLTIKEMLNVIQENAVKIKESLSNGDIETAEKAHEEMDDIVLIPEWNPSKYSPQVKELMEKIEYNINDPLRRLFYNKPKNLNKEVDKILSNILKDVNRIREEYEEDERKRQEKTENEC